MSATDFSVAADRVFLIALLALDDMMAAVYCNNKKSKQLVFLFFLLGLFLLDFTNTLGEDAPTMVVVISFECESRTTKKIRSIHSNQLKPKPVYEPLG